MGINMADYKRLPDGSVDLKSMHDYDLGLYRMSITTEYERVRRECYKRKLVKQVGDSGAVFGESVITVAGKKGEYLLCSMDEQLSRIEFTETPMLLLRKIVKEGEASGKVQYSGYSNPVIEVVGKYIAGKRAKIEYTGAENG